MRFIVLASAVLMAGCSEKEYAPSAENDLDRARAVVQLELVAAALESGQYEPLREILATPPGQAAHFEATLPDAARGLLELEAISADGVKIMAAKGRFGPLAEVFPSRAQYLAELRGSKVEDCKGMGHEGAKAVFCKLDSKWKIAYLDDIGKLD